MRGRLLHVVFGVGIWTRGTGVCGHGERCALNGRFLAVVDYKSATALRVEVFSIMRIFWKGFSENISFNIKWNLSLALPP
jgi:hypothetical protein